MTLLSGCGSKSTPTTDASVESPGDDAGDTGPVHSHCPTTLPGPALVRVGWSEGVAFCIDGTEVTNTDYAAFLAATSALSAADLLATQAPSCQWNASVAPATSTTGCTAAISDGTTRGDYPVVCVNWCDADAYCRWAGKYLCPKGSNDGNNAGPVTDLTAKDGSEWVIACSNDDTLIYPYGNDPMAGLCVDKKFPTDTPGVQPVMTATGCVGGVPGIYDMAGNASEWQDDCVAAAAATANGMTDECDTYGGSASSDYPDTSCRAAAATTDTAAHFTRAQVAPDNGFRCCADAVFF